MIEISSDLSRSVQKFSENVRNVCVAFVWPLCGLVQLLKILWKSSESGRKSLQNRLIVRLCIFFGGQ